MLIERLKHDLRSQERRVSSAARARAGRAPKAICEQLLEALQKDAALADRGVDRCAREPASRGVVGCAVVTDRPSLGAEGAKIAQESVRVSIASEAWTSSRPRRESDGVPDAKIVDLKAQICSTSSLEGWTDAIVASVTIWLTESLWKVLLRCLVSGPKPLRIGRLAEALRHVADDGDDDHLSQQSSAGTIAAVFGGRQGRRLRGRSAHSAGGDRDQHRPIVGSVAILGLAVSFGSQNLVKDVVNGFFILIENQYAVGDVVTIGGNTGTVEKINLRSTRIRQYDGTLHVVPNGSIDSVANQTRDWARVVLTVGVAYESNLGMVEEALTRWARPLRRPRLRRPARRATALCRGSSFADSSVNVRCIVRTTPSTMGCQSRAAAPDQGRL